MNSSILHVRKKDLVQVMSGKEKGKTGKVLRLLNKKNRVLVEKLNMLKKHKKPTGKAAGGIIEIEGSLSAASVLLFCEKCNKGVRTGSKLVENKKVRVCKKCNNQLDK